MANYPSSLDTFVNPTTADTLDNPPHATQHADVNDAVEAIEAKLGIGTSTASGATTGYALVASAGGTTAWSQVGYEGITAGTATSGQVLTAQSGGTALWQDIPNTSGLVHINTTAFSAVSSQSINDVFSATYDNYRIVTTLSATTEDFLNLRLRVSGADETASLYGTQYANYDSTTVGAARTINQNTGRFGVFGNEGLIVGDMTNPFAAKQTHWAATVQRFISTDNASLGIFSTGLRNTTSYTGFTITPASGTITGSISVYGYRKS